MIFVRQFIDSVDVAAAVVIQRLTDAIAPSPCLGRADTELPFQGRTRGPDFRFHRVIRERINSFVPITEVRVVDTPTGSRIRTTMHLHIGVAAFLLAWSSGLLFAAWDQVRRFGWFPPGQRWGAVLPAAMVFAGWVFSLTSFAREVRTTRRLLLEVVQARMPVDAT